MNLPQGRMGWKNARSRIPPWRILVLRIVRSKLWAAIAVLGLITLLWKGTFSSSEDLSARYCFGPAKPPIDMTPNEYVRWNQHLQTPVMFNPHAPYEVTSSTIQKFDLNPIHSTRRAVSNQERVLLLTPLRDAAPYLRKYFDLASQLTYPHDLIDLGFLVGDSGDDTMAVLASEVKRIQESDQKGLPFRSVTIIEKDFGTAFGGMTVKERHGFQAQGPRRKLLGKARNYLLYSTLKPDHSWVYWRDVDIWESPNRIIEDMTSHDRDIIVPNIWFHRLDKKNHDIEGRFDYNSWVESPKGRKLARSLSRDTVLAEGYKEYRTGRYYMVLTGDSKANKHEEIELDGIGGVNVVVKADVHRSGVNFPAYPFENQAETEGFAKMAKRAGYSVIGLPNYIVWEKPGNAA